MQIDAITLTLRPRSKDFRDHGHELKDEKPNVIIAAFGFNESFARPAGLPKFKADLEKFIKETTSTKYNGQTAPKLVLLSPIAQEDLQRVLTALAELPERTRIAVEMHRFGGCKLREIAEHLGISLSMAHHLIKDGVRHCQRAL